MQHLWDWLGDHKALLSWLGAASGVMLLASLVLVPWIAIRIPADYFVGSRRVGWRTREHSALSSLLLVGKNLLGCLFLVAGVAMLVLPGQGLLTMFIGLILVNFPGKYHLERWLVSRGPVLASINWLRQRADHPPLIVDWIPRADSD